MKKYCIQNRSPKNSHACVPLNMKKHVCKTFGMRKDWFRHRVVHIFISSVCPLQNSKDFVICRQSYPEEKGQLEIPRKQQT